MPVLDHPPYSPDLASCDVWFSKVKSTGKGTTFQSTEDMNEPVAQNRNYSCEKLTVLSKPSEV